MATSQNAPLERFLASQRCKQIKPSVAGKRVLDFGCGLNAWNARSIQPICQDVHGVDASLVATKTIDGITLHQSLDELQGNTYDVIIALAVFEHIKPMALRELLQELMQFSVPTTTIVGTVPSTRARRVLEFLSYRLGLIDRSQVRDHKVYYDDLWLSEIIEGTGWRLKSYQRFQLGMNIFFELEQV